MKSNFLITSLFLLVISIFNTANASEKSVSLSIHLLSYLAQDYGEAIGENGKIINEFEYNEQLEFIEAVVKSAKESNFPGELVDDVNSLKTLIVSKREPEVVSRSATQLKKKVISYFNVLTYPKFRPNLSFGKKLYQNNCIQCHGNNGFGDGEAGKGLDPAPSNFHDLERMSNISPFQAYSTISLGVEGTGMASFDDLSEKERWDLAFYISSLRFADVKKLSNDTIDISLKDLASMTDVEIKNSYLKDSDDQDVALAILRTQDNNSGPTKSATKSSLDKARNKLTKSFTLFKQRKLSEAHRLSLEAYLEGIEPIEAQLKNKDSSLLYKLENSLAAYRSSLKQGDERTVTLNYNNSIQNIEHVETLLIQDTTNLGTIALTFGIITREAMEAGLVLLLLFSLLQKLGAKKAKRWVHFGWISALGIGILSYFLLEKLIPVTGELAEAMEAYVGMIAAFMLLYVGLWFHRNSNIQTWKKFLSGKVQNIIGRDKLIGLSIISFSAVFREILETILFVKILVFDGHSKSAISSGVILGIIVSCLLVFLMAKLSIKINLKNLFKLSTSMILIFAVIIVGKSVMAFQKIGYLEVHRTLDFSFPSLGINFSIEALIAQFLMLVAIFFFIRLNSKKEFRSLRDNI